MELAEFERVRREAKEEAAKEEAGKYGYLKPKTASPGKHGGKAKPWIKNGDDKDSVTFSREHVKPRLCCAAHLKVTVQQGGREYFR